MVSYSVLGHQFEALHTLVNSDYQDIICEIVPALSGSGYKNGDMIAMMHKRSAFLAGKSLYCSPSSSVRVCLFCPAGGLPGGAQGVAARCMPDSSLRQLPAIKVLEHSQAGHGEHPPQPTAQVQRRRTSAESTASEAPAASSSFLHVDITVSAAERLLATFESVISTVGHQARVSGKPHSVQNCPGKLSTHIFNPLVFSLELVSGLCFCVSLA